MMVKESEVRNDAGFRQHNQGRVLNLVTCLGQFPERYTGGRAKGRNQDSHDQKPDIETAVSQIKANLQLILNYTSISREPGPVWACLKFLDFEDECSAMD